MWDCPLPEEGRQNLLFTDDGGIVATLDDVPGPTVSYDSFAVARQTLCGRSPLDGATSADRASVGCGNCSVDLNQRRKQLILQCRRSIRVVGCGSKCRKHWGFALLAQIRGMLHAMQRLYSVRGQRVGNSLIEFGNCIWPPKLQLTIDQPLAVTRRPSWPVSGAPSLPTDRRHCRAAPSIVSADRTARPRHQFVPTDQADRKVSGDCAATPCGLSALVGKCFKFHVTMTLAPP